MKKLGAKELRQTKPTSKDLVKIKRNPIYIVLDNILDTYNVGAIFRLADALAVSGVHICGQTATPDDKKVGHKIQKASVGVWRWVPWQYVSTATEAIFKLKSKNLKLKVICVEQDSRSVAYTKIKPDFPVALVVGHETYGVSREVLDMADQIVELPMWGVNKSLNVMVSLAVVLYELMRNRVY